MEKQDIKDLYLSCHKAIEALNEYLQALNIDYKKVKRDSHAWKAVTTRSQLRDFTGDLGVQLCRGD